MEPHLIPLNRGRLPLFVTRWFGTQLQQLQELHPVLQASFEVEKYGAEAYVLQEWKRFGVGTQVALDATHFGAAAIFNPPASNMLCVVEQFACTPVTAAQLIFGVSGPNTSASPAGTAIAVPPGPADSRIIGSSAMVVTSTNQLGAALTSTLEQTGGLATTRVVYSREIVLAPGSSMYVSMVGVNVAFNFGIGWRERSLSQTEVQV